MESLEETVRREVWEESGIKVDQVAYQASQPGHFLINDAGISSQGDQFRYQVDGVELKRRTGLRQTTYADLASGVMRMTIILCPGAIQSPVT